MSEAVAGGVLPARADRVWGAMWVVLGAAITVGALRMERLEAQGVQWFAAPGLVPGILGVIIAVGGVFLSLRSLRAPVLAEETSTTDWRRVGLTLLLCLGFAGGLVGHGAPFGLVAGIYLFAHITLLQWPERRAAGQTLRGLLVAAAVAVGGALAVPFIFETLFLVRLP